MKKHVLILFLIFSSIFFASCINNGLKNITYNQEQNIFTCKYKGKTRKFILYFPENNINKNAPIVFLLHGYGASAHQMQSLTEFDKSACQKNYAVVYVEGTTDPNDKTSSTGWLYYEDNASKDDINFLENLAHYLQKKYGFNRKKTYAVGFSNGAFMCTKLATQKAKTFTSVVSVCGMMPKNVWISWQNNRKIDTARFFQINGTKDDVVPMYLNDSAKYNPNPAMEDVIKAFSNEYKSQPEQKILSNNSTLYKYSDDVWWLLIKDGHHSWPNKSITDFDVNQIILDFFEE